MGSLKGVWDRFQLLRWRREVREEKARKVEELEEGTEIVGSCALISALAYVLTD